MTVIFTKQSPETTHQLRHTFKADNVTQRFLIYLLENGFLQRIQDRIYLPKLLKGKVPKGFDVHHIQPLSGGGTNNLDNLCLIEKSLHKFLNRHCFDPMLKDIVNGETVELDIPDLPPLALYRDFTPFIQQVLQTSARRTRFRHLINIPMHKLPYFRNWKK